MGLVPTSEDIDQLPLPKQDLKALFDYLDRPNPDPCTHTFVETEAFLNQRNLDKSKIIPWLQDNGAGCDCEVIFNVEETWGEIVGREFPQEDEIEPAPTPRKPWWKFW